MAMAGAWLLSLWSWFMGWFKPIWIKLCRWLMAPPFFVPAASARVHKAVVIGDGLAMGLGDRVILGSSGGVASKLQDMIAAKAGKKSPRTGWLVYNCGEVDSTSFDWLPGSASGPDGKKGKGYFGKVFNGVYGRDAEVVIVMLGTSDVLKGVDGMSPAVLAAQPPGQTNVKARYQPADYCATVANLKEICAALLAGNPVRRVLVCDVMSMKDYKVTLGRRGEVLYRLNHQLMDMLADLGGEAADSSTSSSSSGGGGGGKRRGSRRGSTFQHATQELHILCKRRINVPEFINLFHRVHHRSVVTAPKFTTDLRQGPRRKLFCQIHRDLTRPRHRTGPAGRVHISDAYIKMLGHTFLNFFDGHAAVIGPK